MWYILNDSIFKTTVFLNNFWQTIFCGLGRSNFSSFGIGKDDTNWRGFPVAFFRLRLKQTNKQTKTWFYDDCCRHKREIMHSECIAQSSGLYGIYRCLEIGFGWLGQKRMWSADCCIIDRLCKAALPLSVERDIFLNHHKRCCHIASVFYCPVFTKFSVILSP